MPKPQTRNRNCAEGFEGLFQAGLGLPIGNFVTERVRKLQEAIGEQQKITERLLKENNTYLSSKQPH